MVMKYRALTILIILVILQAHPAAAGELSFHVRHISKDMGPRPGVSAAEGKAAGYLQPSSGDTG